MRTYIVSFVCAIVVLVGCGKVETSETCGSGGAGGSGGAHESAYPCGFDGSPMLGECHSKIDNGIPYCGHTGPVDRPFGDCVPMQNTAADTTDWDWWCCPSAVIMLDGGSN